MTDNAVKTANEAEEKILSSIAEWYLHEMREKAYYDNRSALYLATQDGIEQERRRNVRSFLQNGVSVDVVKKSLGLSDEDLKKYLS